MRSALFAYIMNKLRERAVYQSPLLLLFILLVTIFTVEFTIMFLIHYLGIPEWGETLVDSFSLSIVIFPVLYLFVFRPLKLYIAELKNLADMLHDSRDSLNRLLNSMVEGVYGIDTNGNCTFINQAALQIMGYQSEDEFLGKHIHTLIHHSYSDGRPYPASKCRIYCAYQTIQTINVSDEVLWRKDGIAVSVEYWSRPIVIDGVVMGAIVSFVDITERKKAEECLEKQRQELEIIIDSSPVIIFYKDKRGRFLRVNKTFAEALQIPKERFLGKTVFDLYSANIAQGMTNDDQEVLESGCPKINIVEQYESASGIRWVQTDKFPIFSADGITTGLIGFAQDITERKKAADELKRVNEELQEKTEYLERFNGLMVGREMEMIKLKTEVNELLEKSGQPKKYEAPDEVKDV